MCWATNSFLVNQPTKSSILTSKLEIFIASLVTACAHSIIFHMSRARIQAPKALVSRDKVVLASNLLVDIVEAFTAEATNIVLIEDNFKSLRYLATSFIVWSVSKYVATKWIVGTGLIFVFSLPKLYLQHQEKIDHHVAKSSERAKILASQYSEIAKQRATGVYGQAVNATRRTSQSKKKQN
jgi:hypothetical protein